MNFKKILILGGSGILGKQLIKYCNDHNFINYAPTHNECNILDINSIRNNIDKYLPDIIIHAAAFVDTLGCENEILKAIDTNIVGTINLVKNSNVNIKFVYISSEYVFSGNRGMYSVNDRLDPINVYGKTKASSEYIVSILKNYQIIRVPFIKKIHNKVFNNQYCSRYFIEDVPEKIINNIFYNEEKIVHICRERKKLSDFYNEKNLSVEEIEIPTNLKDIIPKDTSLINTNKL